MNKINTKTQKEIAKIIRKYYHEITPPQEQRNRDLQKELLALFTESLKAHDRELIEKLKSEKERDDVYLTPYLQGLDKAIQLIREGEDA